MKKSIIKNQYTLEGLKGTSEKKVLKGVSLPLMKLNGPVSKR